MNDARVGGAVFFQYKFFSNTRVKRYLAVHDEIQAQPGRHPYLVHGVLFIPWERRQEVHRRLVELRDGYVHRIEYREIKAVRSPNYGVGHRWLDWFKAEGAAYCSYKVFAVDQESFRLFPYRGDPDYPHHIWKNTLSSFVAGITWTLSRPKGILLDIACDSSDDPHFLNALGTLPVDLKLDMRERRKRQLRKFQERPSPVRGLSPRFFPMIRVHSPIRLHSSNPTRSTNGYEDETEFIQLTDVLLGSLWDTIEARKVDERRQFGRVALSREWREVEDSRLILPWGQRLPYGKAVSISLYPDEFGRAYPATVLTGSRGQLSFEFRDKLLGNRSERKRRRRDDEHLGPTA